MPNLVKVNYEQTGASKSTNAFGMREMQEKAYKKRDAQYFSYDLKHDKEGLMTTIIPSNIICALWFVGVFPLNIFNVIKQNRFENQNFIYTFDAKSCKLKRKKKSKIKYL